MIHRAFGVPDGLRKFNTKDCTKMEHHVNRLYFHFKKHNKMENKKAKDGSDQQRKKDAAMGNRHTIMNNTHGGDAAEQIRQDFSHDAPPAEQADRGKEAVETTYTQSEVIGIIKTAWFYSADGLSEEETVRLLTPAQQSQPAQQATNVFNFKGGPEKVQLTKEQLEKILAQPAQQELSWDDMCEIAADQPAPKEDTRTQHEREEQNKDIEQEAEENEISRLTTELAAARAQLAERFTVEQVKKELENWFDVDSNDFNDFLGQLLKAQKEEKQ